MKLKVFHFGREVGVLAGSSEHGIIFTYTASYLTEKTARPLSHSLPLRTDFFTTKECLPFFTGLLPDGEVRRKISQYLHVSESSDLKLLEALGGECAGTVSLYKDDANETNKPVFSEIEKDQYRSVEDEELFHMFEQMERRPLLTSSGELRLSLAGAQQKIALARFDNKWHLPLHGAPSTHILKPSRHPFPDLAINETICMNLARSCGLPVPKTEFFFLRSIPVYVIERYDRFFGTESRSIQRIHQEDACQALGIISDKKYEADGGPSFTEVIELVRDITSAPILDFRNLLSLAIFNFLIGNCDAHGKNISLLYPATGGTKLAPFYDLVSTTAYEELTKRLSMKIGGEYRIEKITKSHFLSLADNTGVGKRYMETLIESISINMVESFLKLEESGNFCENADLLAKIITEAKERIEQIA